VVSTASFSAALCGRSGILQSVTAVCVCVARRDGRQM
jgi:hypothetical protein